MLQSLALRSLEYASLSSAQSIDLAREPFAVRTVVEESLQAALGTAITEGTQTNLYLCVCVSRTLCLVFLVSKTLS